jgi:hypothetical protein
VTGQQGQCRGPHQHQHAGQQPYPHGATAGQARPASPRRSVLGLQLTAGPPDSVPRGFRDNSVLGDPDDPRVLLGSVVLAGPGVVAGPGIALTGSVYAADGRCVGGRELRRQRQVRPGRLLPVNFCRAPLVLRFAHRRQAGYGPPVLGRDEGLGCGHR